MQIFQNVSYFRADYVLIQAKVPGSIGRLQAQLQGVVFF
jgi:hypothetical protein